MRLRDIFIISFLLYSLPLLAENCTLCHKETYQPSPFHSQSSVTCIQCHGGNPDGLHKEVAHLGMEPYPGNMLTVRQSCGQAQCHADLVPMVENSIMNTLDGLISVTRKVFEDPDPPHKGQTVAQRLSTNGSDSYMRKLCVSCHLGSERKNHKQSFKDRGGGCAACHLQTFPRKKIDTALTDNDDETGHGIRHPILTLKISNDRCFGCHSRSGRISLNYIGLAETDNLDRTRLKDFGRLYDKRLVEKKTADLHHNAGMACIDCHTSTGLMGTGKRVKYLREQNDIDCQDCHGASPSTKSVNELTVREVKYLEVYSRQLNLKIPEQVIVTKNYKTPLFHIRNENHKRLMTSKVNGKEIEIPLFKNEYYHSTSGHERLSCDACHTDWAPQCYGCHISYKPEQKQWDHIEQKVTDGRWKETRWNVRSEAPALGISNNSKITTFVPGMNLIVPATDKTKSFIKQIFSATSAHTTQKKSRSCVDCHINKASLGIIEGSSNHPEHEDWSTPTGWINLSDPKPGVGTKPGDRSFNRMEIAKILNVGVCLECHEEKSEIYTKFGWSLKNLTSSCKSLPK